MTTVRLARALPAVYAVAAVRLAFPLLVLPLVASRLGAQEFGRLSLLLVWAAVLAVLVEGGFLAAVTRLAVAADDGRRLQLARQVFSARIALSALAALLALAVAAWLLPAPGSPGWLVGVAGLAALACATGWPATWYLQASGQLQRFARVELAVYGLQLAAMLAFANSVGMFLLLHGAGLVAVALLGWRHLLTDLGGTGPRLALWSRSDCRAGLALGWTMLPVSIAGAAYSFALPALASARLDRGELGLYYLADRWVRSLLMGVDPLSQLVYPRIVARFERGARAALALAGRWALAGVATGLAIVLAGWLAWPLLAARLPAGVDAGALAPVLAVLVWLLPLLMGWRAIGQWMLGSGRFDAAYRACMVVGGLCGVLAVWLLPIHSAHALAEVALAVEAIVIAVAVAGIAWTHARR